MTGIALAGGALVVAALAFVLSPLFGARSAPPPPPQPREHSPAPGCPECGARIDGDARYCASCGCHVLPPR